MPINKQAQQFELFSGGLGTPLVYREAAQTASNTQDILETNEKNVFNASKSISRSNQYKESIDEKTRCLSHSVERRKDVLGWKIKVRIERQNAEEYSFLVFTNEAQTSISAIQKYAGKGKKVFSARAGSIVSFNYFHKANMLSMAEAAFLQNFIKRIPIKPELYK